MHDYRRIFLICGFALAIIVLNNGCVKRRLLIRSQPEGALVTIDNQTIGHTPVSTPYTYSGTRDVKVELDGYETIKVQENVRDPLYLRFPLGFFVENFYPFELDVERELDFQMSPLPEVRQNDLLDRASQLRSDVNRGIIATPHTAEAPPSDNRNSATTQVPLGPGFLR
jgi:hypothetical protein